MINNQLEVLLKLRHEPNHDCDEPTPAELQRDLSDENPAFYYGDGRLNASELREARAVAADYPPFGWAKSVPAILAEVMEVMEGLDDAGQRITGFAYDAGTDCVAFWVIYDGRAPRLLVVDLQHAVARYQLRRGGLTLRCRLCRSMLGGTMVGAGIGRSMGWYGWAYEARRG